MNDYHIYLICKEQILYSSRAMLMIFCSTMRTFRVKIEIPSTRVFEMLKNEASACGKCQVKLTYKLTVQ